MHCTIVYCYRGIQNDLKIILETINKAGGKFIEYGSGKGIRFKVECNDLKTFIEAYEKIDPIKYPRTYSNLDRYKKEYQKQMKELLFRIDTVVNLN